MEVNFLSKFPHPEVTVYNASLIDSTAQSSGHKPAFEAQRMRLQLNMVKLQRNEIAIQKLELEDANIVFYTDQGLSYNPVSIIAAGERRDNRKPEDRLQVSLDNTELELSNVSLDFVDKLRKKNIQGTVNKLVTDLRVGKDTSGHVQLDLDVGTLTFNTDKGGYLTGARIVGEFDFLYREQMLQFLPTEININGQDYSAFANLAFDKKTPSLLHVHKEDLQVAHARKLLTRKIQEGISPFDVEGLVKASADIQFYPGDKNPRAVVSLDFPNNTMHAFGLALTDGKLKGRFINRLYEDYDKFYGEDKQNLTFYLDDLDAKYMGFEVKCKNGWINFGPAVGTNLDLKAQVGGNASLISNLLGSDEFIFRGGTFEGNVDIAANADELSRIIKGTDAKLQFKNLNVYYAPEKVTIPIHYIELQKTMGLGKFDVHSITPKNKETIYISGQATNIDDLIAGIPNNTTRSELDLKSDKLSWTGLLSLIGTASALGAQDNPPSQNQTFAQQKKSIKSLLQSIYEGFHPSIYVDIENFAAPYNLDVSKFTTNLGFQDKSTLLLNNTNFKLNSADITTGIKLDLSKPYTTPFEIMLNTAHLPPQDLVRQMQILQDSALDRTLKFLPKELSFRLALKGEFDDSEGLEPSSLDGGLSFDGIGYTNYHGEIKFSAQDASDSNRFINTDIYLTGSPMYINPFFENLNIAFEGGEYTLKAKYNNYIRSPQEIIQNADLDFEIGQTQLNYLTTGTAFPIRYFTLKSVQDEGLLDLMVYSRATGTQISIEGKVDNITELLYQNTGKQVESHLSVYSPKVGWSEINNLFDELSIDSIDSVPSPTPPTETTASLDIYPSPLEQAMGAPLPVEAETESSPAENMAKLKTTIGNLFLNLRPYVDLTLDTLVYSPKLQLRNITSDISMTPDSVIHLDNTKFNYQDGEIAFTGYIDLTKDEVTPYSARFVTTQIDVAELITSLEFDRKPALQKIDSLGGLVNFDLLLESEMIDSAPGVIPENTYGHLDFLLKRLGASGISYIDEIIKNKKLRARLRDIYIDSLADNITITQNKLLIPLMEIQSNAFQFFVEGTYDMSPHDNIWVSIPLSNLRRRRTQTVPAHTGYAMAGGMVFLEIINHPDQPIETKFHLSKRKFFEGNPDLTYKEYKRQIRQERKAQKNKK